jgi:hypothetical protein
LNIKGLVETHHRVITIGLQIANLKEQVHFALR